MVFGGLDDIPVILEGDAEDDLGSHVFHTGLDGADDHGVMPFPGRGDEDAVELLLLFEEVLPGIGASGIDLGLFFAAFRDGVFGTGQHIVVDVADSDDVYVIATEEEAEMALAAEAGADDGEADLWRCFFVSRGGEELGGRGGGQGQGGEGSRMEEVLSVHGAMFYQTYGIVWVFGAQTIALNGYRTKALQGGFIFL